MASPILRTDSLSAAVVAGAIFGCLLLLLCVVVLCGILPLVLLLVKRRRQKKLASCTFVPFQVYTSQTLHNVCSIESRKLKGVLMKHAQQRDNKMHKQEMKVVQEKKPNSFGSVFCSINMSTMDIMTT